MSDKSNNTDTLIELLRKMGHDMRAPLGSIISTVDMMAEGVYDPLSPKQLRANERVRRNSRRVLAILDDFVTYAKADAEQIDLVAKSFNPRTSLSDWCRQIQSTCEEKGLVLHVTTKNCVPSHLIGDATVISRIVLPLLWNAVSFTSQGAIWIDSDWSDDQGWTISVRDSGTGIPADHIPHIFEPFWRGEERPQVASAGAGLGLAVSMSLVQLMKGELILEQTGLQGSTFCVHIPLEHEGS
jgi:signal transduction histidine kinase